MKFLFKLLKRIIYSAIVLYIFDYFAVSYHFVIPINFITISILSFFDVFGLIGLILFKYFIL